MQCDQTSAADLPECVHSPCHALACDCSITKERLTGRELGGGGGRGVQEVAPFFTVWWDSDSNVSVPQTMTKKKKKKTVQGKNKVPQTTLKQLLLLQQKSPRKISQRISRSLTGQNKVQKKFKKKRKRKTKSQVIKIRRESTPDNQISYTTWWWWWWEWEGGGGGMLNTHMTQKTLFYCTSCVDSGKNWILCLDASSALSVSWVSFSLVVIL